MLAADLSGSKFKAFQQIIIKKNCENSKANKKSFHSIVHLDLKSDSFEKPAT